MKTNLNTWSLKKTLTILPIIFFSLPTIAQSDNAGDWLTYHRTYNSERYSLLKQISPSNVKQLHLLHTFDLGKDLSSMQTGPVVNDGSMYFNGAGVISYQADGKQYIAVAAGMKAPLWPKPSIASKILIYEL